MTINQLITKIGRQRVITALANVVCQGSSGSGVTSFNGRTGVVVPVGGDYSSFFLTPAQAAAIYQPLLGYTPSRRIVAKSNVSVSYTGTTNESTLFSIHIPAGTVAANDVISIQFRNTKTGSAGNIRTRIRVHTSTGGSVGTAFSSGTIISDTTGLTILYNSQQRFLVFKNSLSSSSYLPSSANSAADLNQLNIAIGTLTNDFASDQYIIITTILGNSGDTAIGESYAIEIIR